MAAKPAPEPFGPWNIMTRTRGGTVSLLKNLTEEQARAAMQRLRLHWDSGDPWNIPQRIADERKRKQNPNGWSGGFYSLSDGALQQVSCWGPPGKTLTVWPKPRGWDRKWAVALAKLEAELAAEPPKPPAPPPSTEYGAYALAQPPTPVKRKWFS